MRRLRLPVLLLAGLTLTACGSEPVPDQLAAPAELPSPSASPSPDASDVPAGPAASPTVPATERSPAVDGKPNAAEEAELEQFIRDYYDAINRALETGDVGTVEAFSVPECNCRTVPEFISLNYPLGVIEGSRTVLHSVVVQNFGAETASVVADAETPDGRIVAPDGTVVLTIDNGERGPAVHALFRSPEGWKIGQVVE